MERVILVDANVNNDTDFDDSLEEMKSLIEACEMELVKTFTQNMRYPNKNTYIYSGKISEIAQWIEAEEIDMVVFGKDLSASQQKELQKYWPVPVIDRTFLIVKIFEKRAKTKEAFLQVEVAMLKYLKPRLKGSYLQLDRQRGGGHNKGSGEKQIEIDTRNISKQITQREKELKELEKQRNIQRSRRNRTGIKKVALVGYTNTGKSSILNQIMKQSDKEEKRVFEKNMLFATLTTNTRKVTLENKHEFLLSDTVGFVSNLPHGLVEAFHSTLEEVKEADLLIHVLDDSSSRKDIQMQTTQDTIASLDASNIPVLYVYNKCDMTNKPYPDYREDKLFISAKDDASIAFLLHHIDSMLFKNEKMEVFIPYEKGALINTINTKCHVLFQENRDDGVYMEVEVEQREIHMLKDYRIR